jgi:hypothetical protein
MLIYFRGRWPDDEIPIGEPLWLYFEVDPALDVVLRTVDMFEDGHLVRNSIELEQRDGFPCVSIVHGPFLSFAAEAQLASIEAQEFEELWARSIYKALA